MLGKVDITGLYHYDLMPALWRAANKNSQRIREFKRLFPEVPDILNTKTYNSLYNVRRGSYTFYEHLVVALGLSGADLVLKKDGTFDTKKLNTNGYNYDHGKGAFEKAVQTLRQELRLA